MLKKLLKYDFKAMMRILLPLNIAVLVVGVIATFTGFAGYLSNEMVDTSTSAGGQLASAMGAMAALALVTCAMLLFSSTVASFVVAVYRFYRNLFTDEGYLTLTLPVPASQQLLSKTIAGLLWLVINAVIVFCCVMGLIAGAKGFTDLDMAATIPTWLIGASTGLVPDGLDEIAWLTYVSWSLRSVIQMLFMLLMAYASLSLGAAAASRHKVAAGIGIFIGIWICYEMIIGFMSVILGTILFLTTNDILDLFGTQTVLAQLLGIVGFWALCIWVLNRKVNLP